ncbi:MAG TPA: tRNA 2-selenouridine(34) synthase MnmH [Bdellovibrionales bacterium]|nr:tRNA 2-selenouridine(34) synthase MnmH [Bdellovibrionales bacterium]
MHPPIPPAEALSLLSLGRDAFIDVRSPGEFAEGHIPGFVNLPVLNDEERHRVGLTYKNAGQERAIETGHELVEPAKRERVARWVEAARAQPSGRAIVTCWRGGLRSKISEQWIRETGTDVLRVQGGYKALRRELLQTPETPPSLAILTGLTGTGKTKLLEEVPVPKIDLERLANHRGSAFGHDLFNPQPSQTTFENRLAIAMRRAGPRALTEDESRKVGNVMLPNAFKERMKTSPVIVLESPLWARVELIFDGYIREPILRGKSKTEVRAHMLKQLDLLVKQLGGALHAELRAQLLSAFDSETTLEAHSDWIRGLLLRHYDPRYRHAFGRQERKILFQGDYYACHQFLIYWFNELAKNGGQPEMVRA